MTLGTAADVPMGEFWLHGYHTAHSVFEAAGIAHTGGKIVVAAESFTSDDTEAWRAHPASMKPLGDWAFAAGVNRIVFHRYQNQAGLGLSPGMTMGPYGVHWERTQTWWDMVPAYHAYLARLPVHAEAGSARGRCLLPRRRGCAPRFPAAGLGASRRSSRSLRRGL